MRKYLVLLVVFITFASNENKIDVNVEKNALMQTSREWSRLAATKNIEETLGYWADDATVMSQGQPPIQGKKAIRDMIESTSKIPVFKSHGNR